MNPLLNLSKTYNLVLNNHPYDPDPDTTRVLAVAQRVFNYLKNNPLQTAELSLVVAGSLLTATPLVATMAVVPAVAECVTGGVMAGVGLGAFYYSKTQNRNH
jgi:hypothetical protein